MNGFQQGQVCLLIDFENLVRGLSSQVGEDRLDETLDIEILLSLAEEHGRVVVARAYADWRFKEMNQFQFDLYNQGVDLVHVLGRGHKNAVDVKLAVDAIETLWVLPDIGTFVLVSGDRDFIHVLKALRRHGKTVIGVAPDNAVSEDFAALCDRFVAYTSLKGVDRDDKGDGLADGDSLPPLEQVKENLIRILRRSPEGLPGSQIVPALRREISPRFDVSGYGFVKLSEMLKGFGDVLDLIVGNGGGDILVRPRRGTAPPNGDSNAVNELLAASGLKGYRFLVPMEQRRRVLFEIHRAMSNPPWFTWNDVAQRVLEESRDSKLTVSVMGKYQSMLWQSRVFSVLENQAGVPLKERRMTLIERARPFAGLVALYERSAAFKARGAVPQLTARQLAGLLGLDPSNPATLPYCRALTSAEELPSPHDLRVPGIDDAPDPRLVERLQRIYESPEQTHSHGHLVNRMRQIGYDGGPAIDHATASRFIEGCIQNGILLETRDGVIRVYRFVGPETTD